MLKTRSAMFNIFIISVFFSTSAADLCINKEESPDQSCGIHVYSGVTPAQKHELLHAHNTLRRDDLLLLKWHDELQQTAQSWANKCKDTVVECRSTANYKTFVQLISKTQSDIPFNLTAIVNKWVNDPDSPAYSVSDGLSAVDRIGCGIKVSKVYRHGGIAAAIKFSIRTYFVICNYASSL